MQRNSAEKIRVNKIITTQYIRCVRENWDTQ